MMALNICSGDRIVSVKEVGVIREFPPIKERQIDLKYPEMANRDHSELVYFLTKALSEHK